MSDSRVDKLTAHYVKENSHPYADGYPSEAEDLRVEAGWHIGDIEAAGLVVIDPDADDAIERFPASVLELLTALRDAE